MAAKPAQMSHIRELVDVLMGMVGEGWATTIDQHFAMMGNTEGMVIFYLRSCMKVGDENPVIMRDDAIGQRLQWEGITRAMALVKQEDASLGGSLSPSQDQKLAPEDEDALLALFESTTYDLDSEEESRPVKRMVDWTFTIEKLRAKR